MAEPIRFYKGEETGIVHENYHDINTSLFKDQYLKALDEIGAYLSYYKTIDDVNKESDDEEEDEQITKQNKSKKQPQPIELNNIFAFIGERGTGKTSCMKSVADMLYQYRKSTNKNGCEKFLKIDPIDPSTFNDNTNLMQVVIGVMFEKFKDKVASSDNLPNNADRDTYEKNKQNLLKAFQDVKECIKYISNPDLLKCEDDDISQLAGMASVSKLNDKIGKLADKYLEFFDKNILVLQIDDIDLQTKYAYQMVEEIRKYFMHKNIIVLMAVKMEQLAKVIENETAKQYEPLKKLEGITLPEISDMAIRYLLKLIPINHRIYMPTAEVYVDRGLRYFTSREDELKYEGKTGDENKALIGDWTSVKYAITSLIYKKCRFLFYHSKGVVSPIVPRNLRELRHLLAMLSNMKNYHDKAEDVSFREQNKSQFLEYLYSTWINNNIASEDVDIVKNLLNISHTSNFNKEVIQLLFDKYKGTILRQDKIEIMPEIFNPLNVSYNISVADVFTVVEFIKVRAYNRSDKMLLFFIETLYSFKLYEYYDEITAEYHKQTYKPATPAEEIDESIRKMEVIDNVGNYEILVGGSFFNTDYYNFLPGEGSKENSRGNRKINFRKLTGEAEQLIKNDDIKLYKKSYSIKLQLLEFFALCISRIVEKGNDKYNNDYRTRSNLYYDFDCNKNNEQAIFNIGSFFFNIINIKRAYGYVHKDLYKIATAKGVDSLYNKLLAAGAKERKYKNDVHSLLSCASIRNFEILSDFIHRVEYKPLRSLSSSNSGNLKEFFENVSKYKINTYDFNEKGKPFFVSFSYVEPIAELLKITSEKKKDNEISEYESFFDSIYSEVNNETNKKQFDALDVDGIIKKFQKTYLYPIGTVRKKVYYLCKPLFTKQPELYEALKPMLRAKGKDEDKLNYNEIWDILSQWAKISK